MSNLRVRRLGYAMGAEVTGVDLARDLDDETVAEIRKIWLENIVVCIRDQDLTPAQMLACCARFGELNHFVNMSGIHPEYPGITMILSKPVELKGKKFTGLLAELWHSDQAVNVQPPSISFSNAQALPDVGGDTMFANMYLAYETLSPAFQRLIDPLEVVFEVGTSAIGSGANRKERPPVVHSLVRVHPETGRKALYAPSQFRNIVGMSDEESKPFREFLSQHATRYEFTYRHCWRPHDFLIWDNRRAMHRAVSDFDRQQFRHMIRCELQAPPSGHVYAEPEAATV